MRQVKQIWIERNQTLTGLPYGVIWYTARDKKVEYFPTLSKARQYAEAHKSKRGWIHETLYFPGVPQ